MIIDNDVFQIHWKNYEMRQAHFWQSFNRLTFAMVTLWSIPFIYPKLFEILEFFILLFPLIAIFLSVVGRLILAAEYKRLRRVLSKINQMTPRSYRVDFSGLKEGIVGRLMIKVVCLCFILISIADFALVLIRIFTEKDG